MEQEQTRTYTIVQRIDERFQSEDGRCGGRAIACGVCGREVAALWGTARDANVVIARHALAHVARVERAS